MHLLAFSWLFFSLGLVCALRLGHMNLLMHVCTGTIKVFQPFLILLHCLISFCLLITLIYTDLFFFLNNSCFPILSFFAELSLFFSCLMVHCLGLTREPLHNTPPSIFSLSYLRTFSPCCEVSFFFPILHACRIIDTWMHPYVFWQSNHALQSSSIPLWSKKISVQILITFSQSDKIWDWTWLDIK